MASRVGETGHGSAIEREKRAGFQVTETPQNRAELRFYPDNVTESDTLNCDLSEQYGLFPLSCGLHQILSGFSFLKIFKSFLNIKYRF